jgi:hypothetical protein
VVRRIMVPYFLCSNLRMQSSKYAASTMLDIVVESAASPRTKARMATTMVVNRSGNRGGGVWFDEHCEHGVRSVKASLSGCHNKVDALLLEKVINGLTVLNLVCEHNHASLLRDKKGKEQSHDYITDAVRDILEEQVAKEDPFNRGREKQHVFPVKPRGSPFSGLIEAEFGRFLARISDQYDEKY